MGVIGGLCGALLITLNTKFANWNSRGIGKNYPIVLVALISIGTALICYPSIFTRISLERLLESLFLECGKADIQSLCLESNVAKNIIQLLATSLLGIILTSISFGLQIPAGILLPTMAIGASYGRAIGIILQTIQRKYSTSIFFSGCKADEDCVIPGVYAIIGAASALGGVTRLTVSIVVIVFELTGALAYVLPIMVGVMVSKWVGDIFGKEGIYERWISLHEYPYLDNRESYNKDERALTIMTKADNTIYIPSQGESIDSLQSLLKLYPFKGFPIVNNVQDKILLGFISRTELLYALDQAIRIKKLPSYSPCYFSPVQTPESFHFVDMRPWMDQAPITLSHYIHMHTVVSLFQQVGLRYILFAQKGRYKGMLTKKDVWIHQSRLNSNYDFTAELELELESAQELQLRPNTPDRVNDSDISNSDINSL